MARAIKKLRVLGSGFAVIPVGGRRLVQSVPGELSMDHTAVLQVAEVRRGSDRRKRERERERERKREGEGEEEGERDSWIFVFVCACSETVC